MALPPIVTIDDLDPATLTVVGNKVVAQDPTKAPNSITTAAASATPIASGDTVDQALNKLQAQVTAGGGGGGGMSVAQTIGDGVALTYTVIHNFGTLDVDVEVFELSSGLTIYPGIVRTSINAIRVDFTAAIPTNSHRVVIQGF